MKTVPLERKQVDDILGGADAWKNVDQTEGKQTNWEMFIYFLNKEILPCHD